MVGFGFYSACYRRPVAYPVYYPVYTPPVYVGLPAYNTYSTYASSPTYVQAAPAYPREVIVPEPSPDFSTDYRFRVPDSPPPDEDVLLDEMDPTRTPPAPKEAPPTTVPNEQPSGVEERSESPISPERLHQMMLDGTRGFEEGRYDESAGLFRQVMESDPNNVDARLAHAVARFAIGDYAASALSIRVGVLLFPGIVDTTFDLRERYGVEGDFDRQTAALEKWVDERPADIDARVIQGFVYHFTGRRDRAAEVWRHVKQKSQEDAELADVFLSAKSPEESSTEDASISPPSPSTEEQQVGQAEPAPSGTVVYKGTLSRAGDLFPQRTMTVDGIAVEFARTAGDPPEVDLVVEEGDTKNTLAGLGVGAATSLVGRSGQSYRLHVLEIDPTVGAVTLAMTEETL